jgi:hypothetical protein
VPNIRRNIPPPSWSQIILLYLWYVSTRRHHSVIIRKNIALIFTAAKLPQLWICTVHSAIGSKASVYAIFSKMSYVSIIGFTFWFRITNLIKFRCRVNVLSHLWTWRKNKFSQSISSHANSFVILSFCSTKEVSRTWSVFFEIKFWWHVIWDQRISPIVRMKQKLMLCLF